jgi:putative transposase
LNEAAASVELEATSNRDQGAAMENSQSIMGNVIKIDEARIKDHLGNVVRSTVEETLNGLLDAEADRMCGAGNYERSAERRDTRAGHYKRQFHTRAGEVP